MQHRKEAYISIAHLLSRKAKEMSLVRQSTTSSFCK